MNDVLNRGDEVEFIGFDSLESLDETLKYKLETGRWYTVRANLGKNGILLEEIVNSPASNDEGEIGFPSSCFKIIQEKERAYQAALLAEAMKRMGKSWERELFVYSALIALGLGLLAGTNFWYSTLIGGTIGVLTFIRRKYDILKESYLLLALTGALVYHYIRQGEIIDFSDFWTGFVSLTYYMFVGLIFILAVQAAIGWISLVTGESNVYAIQDLSSSEESPRLKGIADTVFVFLIFKIILGFGIVDQLYKFLSLI